MRIAKDSRLAALLGAEHLDVASWHHQAWTAGRDLRAVAWAADGTVEALEDPAHPGVLAVQWHPELQQEEGSPQRRLFRALTDLARERASQGSRHADEQVARRRPMRRGKEAQAVQKDRRKLSVVFETLEGFREEFRGNLVRGGLFVSTKTTFALREEVEVSWISPSAAAPAFACRRRS